MNMLGATRDATAVPIAPPACDVGDIVEQATIGTVPAPIRDMSSPPSGKVQCASCAAMVPDVPGCCPECFNAILEVPCLATHGGFET
jgi:hypothetical protein